MEVLERTQSKVRVTLELEPDEVAVCLCFSGEDLSVEGERTSTTQDMKMEALVTQFIQAVIGSDNEKD